MPGLTYYSLLLQLPFVDKLFYLHVFSSCLRVDRNPKCLPQFWAARLKSSMVLVYHMVLSSDRPRN